MLISYFFEADETIVEDLSIVLFTLLLIIESLDKLVHLEVSEVSTHVGHKVLHKLLVSRVEETRGVSPQLAESVVDLLTLQVEAGDSLLRVKVTMPVLERHDDHFTQLWQVSSQVVSRKNLEIFVHVCELLEVVNVVLVGFDVETEVHTSQLVELAHVDIIAEVVTAEVGVVFAVLVDSLEQLFELLLSLEYVNLFRLALLGLGFLKVLVASVLPKSGEGLSLQAPLLLNDNHLLLQLLLEEQLTVVAFGADLGIIVHIVVLLRLFVQRL